MARVPCLSQREQKSGEEWAAKKNAARLQVQSQSADLTTREKDTVARQAAVQTREQAQRAQRASLDEQERKLGRRSQQLEEREAVARDLESRTQRWTQVRAIACRI